MTAEVTGIIAFVMNVAEGLAKLKSMHAINFRDMRDAKKKQRMRGRNYVVISIIRSFILGKCQLSLKNSHYRINNFVNEELILRGRCFMHVFIVALLTAEPSRVGYLTL